MPDNAEDGGSGIALYTGQHEMPRVQTAIQSEDELDRALTEPRPVLIEFIRSVASPLIILGAGGKMGPTLAVLARRAADAAGHPLEIIAVSRFSDGAGAGVAR